MPRPAQGTQGAQGARGETERGPGPGVLRTPDDRFAGLPGFPHRPRYVTVDDPLLGPLRMHYVDAGPADAPPVLLLHGQPTWSFLWRRVITVLAGRGHRVIAPDLIGFGRSDKPARHTDHTVASHVDWTGQLVDRLDLRQATLVGQDWGGPIGLAVVFGPRPDRFDRLVVTNTILHTCEPELGGAPGWANHVDGRGRSVVQSDLLDYVLATQRIPDLRPGVFVRFATAAPVTDEVAAAYDAPFPDESFKAGPRQLPVLIPLTMTDPAAALGRRVWDELSRWDRPLLTAFSDGDPASSGWDRVFQARVPGAAGRRHHTIEGAGHFLQEDRGEELGAVVADFIESNPAAR